MTRITTCALVCTLALVAATGCERIEREFGGTPKPPPTATPAPAATPKAPPEPPARMEILGELASWDRAGRDERRRVAEKLARRWSRFTFDRMETFGGAGAKAQGREVAIYVNEQTGMEFSLVPAGSFRMGSPATEPGRQQDEEAHTVHLTAPFLIARTEVTQAAWQRVMGKSNPSKNQGADLPVESVKWYDCDDFCRKAKLYLPTEAQWEYACRAGDESRWSFGDDAAAVGDHAWYAANANGTTHAVGAKRPNGFGLLDVHGNVWEWCNDAPRPYGSGTVTDPVGPKESSHKAVRGGCFANPAELQRSAFRYRLHEGDRQMGVGVRPVYNFRVE